MLSPGNVAIILFLLSFSCEFIKPVQRCSKLVSIFKYISDVHKHLIFEFSIFKSPAEINAPPTLYENVLKSAQNCLVFTPKMSLFVNYVQLHKSVFSVGLFIHNLQDFTTTKTNSNYTD